MVYTGYNSIVNVNLYNGIEAYIVPETPILSRGGRQKCFILLENHGDGRSVNAKVELVDPDGNRSTIYSGTISVGKDEKKIYPDNGVEVGAVDKYGEYTVILYLDNKPIDKTVFIVADKSSREPFYFTIVWHHHQAPNYMPDGTVHSPWAYVYVWGGYLAPYGYGPYHYHAKLLATKEKFKATYNLSPSLLYQWITAVEKGVRFVTGETYDPESFEVSLVKEALENYRRALERKQIDVLTSIYAHTIAGFLIDVLDAGDIVDEEVSYGKEITARAMGNNYDAKGVWTPEMAFSMGLIPIYRSNGIEYTVLDSRHHFTYAEGDKDSFYEPYMVLNTATGDYIVAFFRDNDLSDVMGFKNTFAGEYHAWRNAYEYSLLIARKWFDNRVKTLVIALDGENWMVFPRNPPMTAVFLDKLSDYLISISDNGFIKLSNLAEIYNEVPARKVLKYIPTNTWLGTFRKWRGEKPDHEQYWVEVARRYRMLRAYERMIGGRDDNSRRARWALWHALDSDYWWAEFWSPHIISTWLKEFDNIIHPIIASIKIDRIEIIGDVIEGGVSNVLVRITNNIDREVRVALRLGGLGIEITGSGSIKPLMIKPRSSYDRIVKARFIQWGKAIISAALTIDGYLIDVETVETNVKPYIRPNPA